MKLALTPTQAEEMWTWDEGEILKELGKESYANLKELYQAKGIKLKDLAESIGTTPKGLRKGVKEGSRFPHKPGAFDAMCRRLDFEPSEADKILGGIYAVQARGETIDARGAALAKLLRMGDVYRHIKDPYDLAIADAAINALWAQLNLLADRQE